MSYENPHVPRSLGEGAGRWLGEKLVRSWERFSDVMAAAHGRGLLPQAEQSSTGAYLCERDRHDLYDVLDFKDKGLQDYMARLPRPRIEPSKHELE